MSDATASPGVQALGIHQGAVHAYFIATKLDSFEIYKPIEFATPAVNYKRNLAAALPTVELFHRIEFATPAINYKRNLASASPTVEILHRIQFATAILRIPPVSKVFYPAALIDVRFGLSAGDSHSYIATRIDTTTKLPVSVTLTYSGASEIIYNIPPHLSIRPRLLAPPNGSFNRTGVPVMKWIGTSQAIYYEVHVARDIDFVQMVARFETMELEIQRFFEFGETYFWKVRAVAGLAYSDFSETWSFSVLLARPETDGTHDQDGRRRLLWQFTENH